MIWNDDTEKTTGISREEKYGRLNITYVDVVRCKDCKHCFTDGDNVRFNVCELNHNKVQSDDWFCADGERKETT